MYGAIAGGCMSDDYYEKMDEEMSEEEKEIYGDYRTKEQAEMDAHDLIRAQEIKADKDRYKMAMMCAKKKAEAMKKVANDA